MLNVNMLDGTNSSKKYERVKYDIVKIRSYPPDGAAVIGEVLDCHYSFSAFVSSSISLFTWRWIRWILLANIFVEYCAYDDDDGAGGFWEIDRASGMVGIRSILSNICNNGPLVFVNIIRYYWLLMLMWMTFHWAVDRREWSGEKSAQYYSISGIPLLTT